MHVLAKFSRKNDRKLLSLLFFPSLSFSQNPDGFCHSSSQSRSWNGQSSCVPFLLRMYFFYSPEIKFNLSWYSLICRATFGVEIHVWQDSGLILWSSCLLVFNLSVLFIFEILTSQGVSWTLLLYLLELLHHIKSILNQTLNHEIQSPPTDFFLQEILLILLAWHSYSSIWKNTKLMNSEQ